MMGFRKKPYGLYESVSRETKKFKFRGGGSIRGGGGKGVCDRRIEFLVKIQKKSRWDQVGGSGRGLGLN